jgi:hypothetical protein
MRNLDWEFAVVESPEVNAFVVPGGKVVVYTGGRSRASMHTVSAFALLGMCSCRTSCVPALTTVLLAASPPYGCAACVQVYCGSCRPKTSLLLCWHMK